MTTTVSAILRCEPTYEGLKAMDRSPIFPPMRSLRAYL